jgi:hypothetical protein
MWYYEKVCVCVFPMEWLDTQVPSETRELFTKQKQERDGRELEVLLSVRGFAQHAWYPGFIL